MSVNVVVVGNDRAALQGMSVACEGLGWQVLGHYASPMSALAGVVTTGPEFTIVDARVDAVQLLKDIGQMRCRTRCIVVGAANNRYVRNILDCGADGYLLEDVWVSQLTDAIASIRAGGVYVSPGIQASGAPAAEGNDETDAGTAGVREPHPPQYPPLGGSVAIPLLLG